MAQALSDILVKLLIELYVDDRAMAGNEFIELLECLCTFFTRCRQQNLSISPTKMQLFMSEVIFRGAR
jgi:hypothetical protein